jgi:hypothetical protein
MTDKGQVARLGDGQVTWLDKSQTKAHENQVNRLDESQVS